MSWPECKEELDAIMARITEAMKAEKAGAVSQAPTLMRDSELAAISATLNALGNDELRVIRRLAERLLMGQRQYGALNLAEDKRDFRKERSAEIEDLLVYTAFLELQREGK